MIELTDVEKTYRMGDEVVRALRGVTLTIDTGEFVAITGASGSGKSTLMHIIGLLDVPDKGSYRLNGASVARLDTNELAVRRREQIGFIFQQFHLLPRTTAMENVSMPLLYSQHRSDLAAARDLLERVGLGKRVMHRPNELSGGQQQRVAIARALINRPRILLADEPTGNLDSVTRDEIMALLKQLNSEGITVILVTHEPDIARMAHRCIRMHDGRVESDERSRARASSAIKTIATPVAPISKSPVSRSSAWNWREWIEHVRQGVRSLAANKVRTALSVLGILIGVAAVVATVAVGGGAKQAVEQQLASLGSNLLVLRSGAIRVAGVSQEAGSTTRLTVDDAAAIQESVAGVKGVSPTVSGRARVSFGNRNWNTQVQGTGIQYESIRSLTPTIGRFFTEEENRQRARVALVGMTIVREVFGGENPIGQMLKINKTGFQVIGVLPEKGSSGFRDSDDTVIVPLYTGMYRVLGKSYVENIEIQAQSADLLEPMQDEILQLMWTRHRVPVAAQPDAFTIRNLADIQAAMQESSRTLSLMLSSIAAISLLVGGIGIMNIMLVSVTERTREIGLRKAVGARARDILAQFLIESVVVSALGGLVGIATGAIIAMGLARWSGWSVMISPRAIVLAFVFSAGIGVIFGIYPARRAAALNPIEALRYE